MVVFPHAKLNLGLHVTGRYNRDQSEATGCTTTDAPPEAGHEQHMRKAGYHEIESIMIPLGVKDILEVVPASNQPTTLRVSGLQIPANGKINLCLQAYELLRQEVKTKNIPVNNPWTGYPETSLPNVRIFLHKIIPAGSGLGGGSSNAGFTLMLLNKMFDLGMSVQHLDNLCKKLGSDCPFFLYDQPMLATGRGEILQPLQLPQLKKYTALVIAPPIHVSTKTAYSLVKPKPAGKNLWEISKQNVETWQQDLVNDLEEPVFRLYPEIRQIKEKLLASGAVCASMSGSGSALYGLFRTAPPEKDLQILFPGYRIDKVKTDVFQKSLFLCPSAVPLHQ
ncbi:MAG: 4-(cytidine 5'-diphospho)-2-C-methyl-D-erythritol kinase [Bacteroidia bacterium]|nr:MAG: 4-(cytidine 5'-diphospho)-2-C-methyl-D-erythritol kinase [Bacteroidia bacterium]